MKEPKCTESLVTMQGLTIGLVFCPGLGRIQSLNTCFSSLCMFLECVLRMQNKKAEFSAFLVFGVFFPLLFPYLIVWNNRDKLYHMKKDSSLYEGKNYENKSVSQ